MEVLEKAVEGSKPYDQILILDAFDGDTRQLCNSLNMTKVNMYSNVLR